MRFSALLGTGCRAPCGPGVGEGKGLPTPGWEVGQGSCSPLPQGHIWGRKRRKQSQGQAAGTLILIFTLQKKQGEASAGPIRSAGAAGEGEPSIFSSLKAPTRLLQRPRSTWIKQHPSEFDNAARSLWNTSNVFSPFPSPHDCSIISSSLDLFKQAFRCSSNGSHLGPSADMYLFIAVG